MDVTGIWVGILCSIGIQHTMVAFVNPSMLTSAQCTDFSTLHGSGCGAPHGCEYIYGYYKFKTPIMGSSWDWNPSIFEGLNKLKS